MSAAGSPVYLLTFGGLLKMVQIGCAIPSLMIVTSLAFNHNTGEFEMEHTDVSLTMTIFAFAMSAAIITVTILNGSVDVPHMQMYRMNYAIGTLALAVNTVLFYVRFTNASSAVATPGTTVHGPNSSPESDGLMAIVEAEDMSVPFYLCLANTQQPLTISTSRALQLTRALPLQGAFSIQRTTQLRRIFWCRLETTRAGDKIEVPFTVNPKSNLGRPSQVWRPWETRTTDKDKMKTTAPKPLAGKPKRKALHPDPISETEEEEDLETTEAEEMEEEADRLKIRCHSILRKDRLLQSTDYVCEKHFEPRHVTKTWEAVYKGRVHVSAPQKAALAKDAVPMKFPDCPAHSTKTEKKKKGACGPFAPSCHQT
ncbi:hypothetical protein HPB49_026630 [Dermacentor silvarum]|nr:hypothetical protein HPB49_026630 [Dermacentor silvarum]